MRFQNVVQGPHVTFDVVGDPGEVVVVTVLRPAPSSGATVQAVVGVAGGVDWVVVTVREQHNGRMTTEWRNHSP